MSTEPPTASRRGKTDSRTVLSFMKTDITSLAGAGALGVLIV